MIPNNTRPALTEDLDHCAFHPERESVGWRDVVQEDGGAKMAVGVCVECAIGMGGTDGAGGPMLISAGAACLCGPGFCASAAGVGFVGTCGGSRTTTAPNCARCGAGHQSGPECWLCLPGAEAWEKENTAVYLRMLVAGVRGPEVFEHQDAEIRAGRYPTFAEAADAVIALRAASVPK
jgi:hypothetical protein